MAVRPFIIAPDDYAEELNIVGEYVTVLASGEETEGYEIFLQRGPEGSGPPPHSHPWDESFYVVKVGIDRRNLSRHVGEHPGGTKPRGDRDHLAATSAETEPMHGAGGKMNESSRSCRL